MTDEPKPGSRWKHHSGRSYTVLMLVNGDDRPDTYPRVVYQGENGKRWSRPLADWHRSMTYEGSAGSPPQLDLAHLRRVTTDALDFSGPIGPAVKRHIAFLDATRDPATILALLDRLEAAERVVERAKNMTVLVELCRVSENGAGPILLEQTVDAEDGLIEALATHAALTRETNKQDTHP